jgi:hypothetical protein
MTNKSRSGYVAHMEELWNTYKMLFGWPQRPTEGTDVCVRLCCVSVAALRRADHSSKESYRLVKKDYETKEEARAQQRAAEPLLNETNEWMTWRYEWFNLLRDTTSCSPLIVNRCVGRICRLHFQSQIMSQEINQYEADRKLWPAPCPLLASA